MTSPVSVAVQEVGGSGHTTIALQTTNDDGTITTSSPGGNLLMTRARDQVVIAYDGKAPRVGYSATFPISFEATVDPNGIGSVAGALGLGTLAPLFINMDPDLGANAPHATFGFDETNGLPMISETLESGPAENPAFVFSGAEQSTQAQDSDAPAPGSPQAATPCSTSSFPTVSSVPYIVDFTGGPAQTCVYKIGDGTTGGQESIELAYTPPVGVSFYPSSYVGIDCGTDGQMCASAYQGISNVAEFTTATTSPRFAVVSCTADANSGCYNNQHFTGGLNSEALCVNDSGYVAILQDAPTSASASGQSGRFGLTSNDPNAKNTGDFTCTFGISDGVGTTGQLSESFHVKSASDARTRNRAKPSSKAMPPYARQAAALSAYAALLVRRKAASDATGARISAELIKHTTSR